MASSPDGDAPPASSEAASGFVAASQARPSQRAPEPSLNSAAPPILPQQSLFAQGLNPADPHTQAQMLHLLNQLGVTPQAWASASQQATSSSLDQLLAHMSRQPDVANPQALLSQLASIAAQHQQKLEGGVSQAEAGQSAYAQHLYAGAAAGSGLRDSELKDDSGDLGGLDDDPKASSVKCAKEKNRQAQRRFRERQKGLIQQLKDTADNLGKQVEEQKRQIEALEKEIGIMRILLQDKGKS